MAVIPIEDSEAGVAGTMNEQELENPLVVSAEMRSALYGEPETAPRLNGVYALGEAEFVGSMTLAESAEEGTLSIQVDLEPAVATKRMSLVAHVRATWIDRLAAGTRSSGQRANHVAAGLIALALLPAQRTVAVRVDGVASFGPRCQEDADALGRFRRLLQPSAVRAAA